MQLQWIAKPSRVRSRYPKPSEPVEKSVANLQSTFRQCPYCGEQIEFLVDGSISRQEYVEDCSVCCRPIVITVVTSGGEVVSIEARSEDE